MARVPFTVCKLLVLLSGCTVEPRLEGHLATLIDEGLAQVHGDALVIVNLRVPEGLPDADVIAAVQQRVIDRRIAGFTPGRRYQYVPAMAGRATPTAIEQLARDPDVMFVQEDHRGAGHLKEAVPAIGADLVHDTLGITGRGVRVAVLDTGVDTDHPDLRDALIAQRCFTQRACPSFASEGASAEDDNGHGSNVAGIMVSRGNLAGRGFAPDAELVAVKINDANDSGQESDWVAGMDWVYANLKTTNVKVVNLSFGTSAMYRGGATQCDAMHPALARAIDNLVDAGVVVFVATGNRGSTTSMPAPACNSDVIAVGAVYDSSAGRQPPQSVASTYQARWGSAFASCSDATSSLGTIACFTNSTDKMDLVAPGAPIVSASLRGRTEMFWGTSQASPAAAGVAALMLQCDPELSPRRIKEIMRETGEPVVDARNGLTFPSLRARAAVEVACGSKLDAGIAKEPDAGLAYDAAIDDASEAVPEDAVMEPEVVEQAEPDASRTPRPSGGSGAPRDEPEEREGCQLARSRDSAGALWVVLVLLALRWRSRAQALVRSPASARVRRRHV